MDRKMIFFNGSYHRLTLELEGRVVNSLWRLKTGEKSSVFAGYRRFSHTKKTMKSREFLVKLWGVFLRASVNGF